MEAILTIIGISAFSTASVFVSVYLFNTQDEMILIEVKEKFSKYKIKEDNDYQKKTTFNKIIEVIYIPQLIQDDKLNLWYNKDDFEEFYKDSLND